MVKGSGGVVNSLWYELVICFGRLVDDVYMLKRVRKLVRWVMVGIILVDLLVFGWVVGVGFDWVGEERENFLGNKRESSSLFKRDV